jgi:hypothetical protein
MIPGSPAVPGHAVIYAITLTKELGQTEIEGQGLLDAPPWKWPER